MEIWNSKFKSQPDMCFKGSGCTRCSIFPPCRGDQSEVRSVTWRSVTRKSVTSKSDTPKCIAWDATALQVTINKFKDKWFIPGQLFQEALGWPIPGHIGHPCNDSAIFPLPYKNCDFYKTATRTIGVTNVRSDPSPGSTLFESFKGIWFALVSSNSYPNRRGGP